MKVLLRENISTLGEIGEVVDVKPGYARNFLIPQRKADVPTKQNIREVEQMKAAYLEQLAKMKEELEAKAKVVDGKELTITARANEEGHLYGSVGPAQIAAVLAKENASFVEAQHVDMPEAIRELDKYEVRLNFG